MEKWWLILIIIEVVHRRVLLSRYVWRHLPRRRRHREVNAAGKQVHLVGLTADFVHIVSRGANESHAANAQRALAATRARGLNDLEDRLGLGLQALGIRIVY